MSSINYNPHDPRSYPIVARYASPSGYEVTVRDISQLDAQESWVPGRPIPRTFWEKLLGMPVRREAREVVLPFDGWRHVTLESRDQTCSFTMIGDNNEDELVRAMDRLLQDGGGDPKV